MPRTAHRPMALPPASQGLFDAAVRHHQAGRLLQAETLYRRVLAVRPKHADSLHLLGVLALQNGCGDLAIALIGQAIALDESVALYHASLGNALQAQGGLQQAEASYRQAIALNPSDTAIWNNLGATLQAQGRLAEAEVCLRHALTLGPDGAETLSNLGNVLMDQGRTQDAIACFRQAIARWPSDPAAHNNLGAALKAQGDLPGAAACYEAAVALRPNFAAAHSNLGIVLHRLGRLAHAAASCRKAIAHQPDLLAAHDTLGSVMADQDRLEEAAACYRRALARWPDQPRLHDHLGTVLKAQGRLDEAIDRFRTAIRHDPGFANAHHNLGMALLARGDLAEGWREYEWRWRLPGRAGGLRDRPQWLGEKAAGRTLLIHAEQGFGDTIQFCRYATLAAASGLRVVMQVPVPLQRLLRALEGVDQLVAQDEACPDFDLHCPMLSLPLALGTTLETIPGVRLHADPGLADRWGRRLGEAGRRVGLVWAGNPGMVHDRLRSLAPADVAPLLTVPGLAFVSLQKDSPLHGPAHGLPLTDVMAEVTDFADTAGLIANLDLVIAADTAVAHLAAAMGKPVWLLDRFDGDWRWLTGRRDSPWYPTLRVYRQSRPGDWAAVVAAVGRDLAAWGADV